MQHLFGLHTEAHLANRVADDLHETVVEFGDKVGTNGADTTSVDASGLPTLWDSKYRSSGVKFIESETFTVESSRLRKAADQAIEAVLRDPNGRLSPQQVSRQLYSGTQLSVTSSRTRSPRPTPRLSTRR